MLKSIFTWWNSATIGIRFTVARRGVFVGGDDYGNSYYEARDIRHGDDGRKRRWVIYRGYAEASKVPAEWHGWLHHTFDEPPTIDPLKRRDWEQDHLPNLTGTIHAWRPKGAISRGGERAKASGDYEAWEARLNPRSIAIALLAGASLALAAGLAVLAQPSDNQTPDSGSSSTAAPPGVPVIQAPPEVTPPDNGASDDNDDSDQAKKPASNSASAKPPAPPVVVAPKPVRSPSAVLQALDKVTAETMRFAAPVGQPVRYKNLVFTVKACETTGLGEPSPHASAYVVIDFAPLGAEGIAPPPPRQVFKGWLFANSPGLNPFQHPTYDAWLITCMAAAPPA